MKLKLGGVIADLGGVKPPPSGEVNSTFFYYFVFGIDKVWSKVVRPSCPGQGNELIDRSFVVRSGGEKNGKLSFLSWNN